MNPILIRVFRTAFAPQFSTAHLEHLAAGLEADDPDLIHGLTYEVDEDGPIVSHTPVKDERPLVACCATVYGAWKAGEIHTGEDADNLLQRVWEGAYFHLGGPENEEAATLVGLLFHHWDRPENSLHVPAEPVRRWLLDEVRRELAARGRPQEPRADSLHPEGV